MITSASNKSIKNVQALLSKAKERKKQGVFVVDALVIIFFSFYIDDMRVKKYFAPHL